MKKKLLRIMVIFLSTALLVYFNGGINILGKNGTTFAVGDLSIDWGVPSGDPIFVVADMTPGDSQERVVDVTNNAPSIRPVGVRGTEATDSGNLSDILTIEIKEGVNTLYGPKPLSDFFTDSMDPSGIELSNLSPSEMDSYTLKLTFNEDAGEEYAGQNILFDLVIGIAFEVPEECQEIEGAWNPIFGTSESDNIVGTKGNDIIIGFEGDDTIKGKDGMDCILGGQGKDMIDGNDGDDVIFGEGDDDRLDGNDGNDKIFGGSGNDILVGRNGNDTLIGEEGDDRAKGRHGTDTCDAELETNCEI